MVIDRRAFLAASAGMAVANSVDPAGQSPPGPPIKTVRTGVLEIGYHESGDPSGVPVILLHGFPDDAHAYDGVLPLLAKAGFRGLAVYLRGFGPTRFLDPSAPRMAEQAAIGQDVIDFADALKLPPFVAVGYDWGGRAGCVAAALHPDRVRAIVPIGGYSIQNTVTPPSGAPNPAAVRRLFRHVVKPTACDSRCQRPLATPGTRLCLRFSMTRPRCALSEAERARAR